MKEPVSNMQFEGQLFDFFIKIENHGYISELVVLIPLTTCVMNPKSCPLVTGTVLFQFLITTQH